VVEAFLELVEEHDLLAHAAADPVPVLRAV